MKEAVFEIETVMVRLDPESGELMTSNGEHVVEIDEDDSMGVTRALSVKKSAAHATPDRSNLELDGIVKNETLLWQEPSPWPIRSALSRVQAWLGRGNNRRSVILLMIEISLAAVLLLTLKSKAPRQSVSLMQSAAAEDRPVPKQENAESSPFAAPSVSFLSSKEISTVSPLSEDESAVRLKDAVDALTQGRLDEALTVYRELSAAHPDNASFALTVQILGGEKGGPR